MVFIDLNTIDRDNLKYEVVSNRARLKLTRLIRRLSHSDNHVIELIKQNRFVNIANNVLGKQIYVLESDDMGEYMPAEYGWHNGQIELIMRLPSTIELIEILADMIQSNLLDIETVNEIITSDTRYVSFEKRIQDDNVSIIVTPTDEIDEGDEQVLHPNIRVLIKRMDNCFNDEDYAGVLHAGASVFETLAKEVFDNPAVQNKTLRSFFEGYRNRSNLPEVFLDYILEIYERRNTEPMAGHGSTLPSTISREEAITLCEMTKTIVRIERKLSSPQVE